MKKSLAIATVSLLALTASAGVAEAKYPPLEEVRPDKKVSNISFDRSPKSIPVSAQPISAPVANNQRATINAPRNQIFTVIIPNVEARKEFDVRITAPGGRTVDLPEVKSSANGTLTITSLAITAPGTYIVKIKGERTTRTVRVVISE